MANADKTIDDIIEMEGSETEYGEPITLAAVQSAIAVIRAVDMVNAHFPRVIATNEGGIRLSWSDSDLEIYSDGSSEEV